MNIYVYFISVLLLNKLKLITGYKWTDIDNKTISVTDYCEDKKCVVKCCPKGFIYHANDGELRCTKHEDIQSEIKYTTIHLYERKSSGEIRQTNKTLSDFEFVIFEKFWDPSKTMYDLNNITILEDGTFPSVFGDFQTYEYCVELYLKSNESLDFLYQVLLDDETDEEFKDLFNSIGMLISCFFILLVLLVYSALPKLQNIVGMVLMAYLFTLMVSMILRSTQTLADPDAETCRYLSPAGYFFMLASFFWLNVMSFDVWWTVRGARKCRAIHRQGELVKFLWYSLYAFGSPALMTLILVLVDRLELYTDENSKPPFDSCFAARIPTQRYVVAPIEILTIAHIILFFMTVYNIWLVKRDVNSKDSENTRKNQSRFIVYVKLSVVMGLSWILEAIPNDIPLTLFIIVNFCNVFIGIVIFVIFVCKKHILIMLCKRFTIQNQFVDKLESSQNSRSRTLKSRLSSKSNNLPTKNDEGINLTSTASEALPSNV